MSDAAQQRETRVRLCAFSLRKGVQLRLTNEFASQTRGIDGTVVFLHTVPAVRAAIIHGYE